MDNLDAPAFAEILDFLYQLVAVTIAHGSIAVKPLALDSVWGLQTRAQLSDELVVVYCAGVSTQWTIHGEKLVDENRHIRLSTVDITLPDGVSFTQYVVAMPSAAMTLTVNDQREVLLMRRHRFIIDRWVWELPGGYVDGAEDIEAAAAREVEEETGWRPRSMEHMVTFQPAIGSVDQPQIIYLARGADLTDTPPDIHEAQEIRWWPLEKAVKMIERGEIVGASPVVAVYRALTLV